MLTFIFTLAIILASIAGLAVSILSGRAPLNGSCGGIARIKDCACAAGCKTQRQTEDTP